MSQIKGSDGRTYIRAEDNKTNSGSVSDTAVAGPQAAVTVAASAKWAEDAAHWIHEFEQFGESALPEEISRELDALREGPQTAANGETLVPHGTVAVAEVDRVRVEMVFEGEGFDGHFDEDDEDDRQLVRFEVSIRATGDDDEDGLIEYGVDAGEWGAPRDASWCTGIEAAQDPEFIEAWATRFAEDLNRVVGSGDASALRAMISAASFAGDTDSFPWRS